MEERAKNSGSARKAKPVAMTLPPTSGVARSFAARGGICICCHTHPALLSLKEGVNLRCPPAKKRENVCPGRTPCPFFAAPVHQLVFHQGYNPCLSLALARVISRTLKIKIMKCIYSETGTIFRMLMAAFTHKNYACVGS